MSTGEIVLLSPERKPSGPILGQDSPLLHNKRNGLWFQALCIWKLIYSNSDPTLQTGSPRLRQISAIHAPQRWALCLERGSAALTHALPASPPAVNLSLLF